MKKAPPEAFFYEKRKINNKTAFDLDRIAFIGRTCSEYLSIFGLVERELSGKTVPDRPGGASSYTAEARGKGMAATACGGLGLDFHMAALKGLVRVSSNEARVFPLTGLDGKPYEGVDEVLSRLRATG